MRQSARSRPATSRTRCSPDPPGPDTPSPAETVLGYNFRAAEPRWQAEWADRNCFRAEDVPADGKPKFYVLEMFPYPSGQIHMGHVRNYTIGDVVARYKRARGHSVLHPMGWDAFGLPAENAARDRGVHPDTWTRANIAAMRAELQRMGLSLDWSREFATCDPSYYGHQQRLFLDLLRSGLVDRRESWVNWDPVDGTVLANEQVVDGRGWRSGAPVEKRQLAQWFFRITHYAEALLAALDGLDRWPERVRTMQARWIGRSEGARIRFPLTAAIGANDTIEVYSTRPDTLFGMSFLAIAPEHPVAAAAAPPHPAPPPHVAPGGAPGPPRAPRPRPPPTRPPPPWARRAERAAPARRRSKPPKSAASTPACASGTPSSRVPSSRSGSPTSC